MQSDIYEVIPGMKLMYKKTTKQDLENKIWLEMCKSRNDDYMLDNDMGYVN